MSGCKVLFLLTALGLKYDVDRFWLLPDWIEYGLLLFVEGEARIFDDPWEKSDPSELTESDGRVNVSGIGIIGAHEL